MWPKLLIVVSCLYVGQASVVPSSFNDEDITIEDSFILTNPDPEVSEAKLKDCNWGWCTQHCRQRGYPYGSCVNGRCECYRRHSALPAEHPSFTKLENTPDDNLVAVTDDEANLSEARSDDCNWRCEQNCYQRGFSYGTCVNGQCHCYRRPSAMHAVHPLLAKFDNTLDVTGDEANPEVSEAKLEDCNWNWCEQHCRSMGYSDGTCRNGRCQCYRHRSSVPAVPMSSTKLENTLEDKELNSEVSEAKLEDCNSNWCEQHCRNMGYFDGTCRNGRCQCYRHRYSVTSAPASSTKFENTLEYKELNLELSEAKLEDCNWTWCEQHCRNMGYSDGTCRNGRCQCYHRHHSEESAVPASFTKLETPLEDKELNLDVSEAKLEDCNWNWCEQHCRNMGYSDGTCRNGRCQCYHRHRSAESAVPAPFTKLENTLEDKEVNPEVSEAKLKDCNWRWCEQDCRRRGYWYGTCSNGQCQCYRRRSTITKENTDKIDLIALINDFKTENELNPDVSEAKLGDCNWRWCEQDCHHMGFSNGTCRHGRCECDHRHRSAESAEPASPLMKSANCHKDNVNCNCNWTWCTQHCRQRGYPYGSCENGRCECYRYRSELPAEHRSFMKENANEDNLITLTKEVSEAKMDDCNRRWCDQSCRRYGQSGGSCVNGHCECYRHLNSHDNNHIILTNEAREAKSNDCNWSWCDQNCRQHGWSYGTCASGHCECYRRRSAMPELHAPLSKLENTHENNLNNPTNEVSEASSNNCNWNWCNQKCRNSGYWYGLCTTGRCECYGHRSAKLAALTKLENISEDSLITPINEVPEGSSTDCNWNWCNQNCRHNGYSYGTCASGHCQCYRRHSVLSKFENTLDTPANGLVDSNEVDPEVSEAGLEDCNWRWCEQHCRSMGFSDGTCRSGRCVCDHRHHPAMSAIPASFTKLDDDEESEKQCSSYSCLQFCRHLGFRFSHCINGSCTCYR